MVGYKVILMRRNNIADTKLMVVAETKNQAIDYVYDSGIDLKDISHIVVKTVGYMYDANPGIISKEKLVNGN